MSFAITDSEIKQEFEDSQAFINGHFVLSSGKHSNMYIQCAKVMLNTQRSKKVLSWLSEKILLTLGDEIKGIDAIISPAIGGIIAGYEVARYLKKDFIFFERVNKQFQLRRGFEVKKGSNVLIVEDVITTGGSCNEIIKYLTNFSVQTKLVASLIDRSNGTAQKNLNIKTTSLLNLNLEIYDENNLPDELKSIPVKIPGTKAIGIDNQENCNIV